MCMSLRWDTMGVPSRNRMRSMRRSACFISVIERFLKFSLRRV